MTPDSLHIEAEYSSQNKKENFLFWTYLEFSVFADECQSNCSNNLKAQNNVVHQLKCVLLLRFIDSSDLFSLKGSEISA